LLLVSQSLYSGDKHSYLLAKTAACSWYKAYADKRFYAFRSSLLIEKPCWLL